MIKYPDSWTKGDASERSQKGKYEIHLGAHILEIDQN